MATESDRALASHRRAGRQPDRSSPRLTRLACRSGEASGAGAGKMWTASAWEAGGVPARSSSRRILRLLIAAATLATLTSGCDSSLDRPTGPTAAVQTATPTGTVPSITPVTPDGLPPAPE